MKRALCLALIILTLSVAPPAVRAVPVFVLEGRITDSDGKPVEGGEVFVYNTARTRRPADFISPRSDGAGHYRTELPAGQYWVVARVRDGASYGPLPLGRKHSGEAREMEGEAGGHVTLDFTVADVRDMARSRPRSGDDFRLVEGRILDGEGKPVHGAYAFARPATGKAGFPPFISPLSDEDGRYDLYIPDGTFCVGAAMVYPPEKEATCAALDGIATTNGVAKDLRLHYSGKIENSKIQLNTDGD